MISDTPIFDITKLTLLDYPDHLACIAWFALCNMRCSYCYNPDIVLGRGSISTNELLNFLRSRKNRLEAVVLSGGECTLYQGLNELCAQIKELGFKVKIDTNGSRPEVIKQLLERGVVDYIALDFKAPKELFAKITKCDFYDKTLSTLRLLIEKNHDFEVRTTVHADLIDERAVQKIAEVLSSEGYRGAYYLQNYLHAPKTLGSLQPPSRRLNTNLIDSKIAVKLRNF